MENQGLERGFPHGLPAPMIFSSCVLSEGLYCLLKVLSLCDKPQV